MLEGLRSMPGGLAGDCGWGARALGETASTGAGVNGWTAGCWIFGWEPESVREGQECNWPSPSSKGPATLASSCAAAAEASPSQPAVQHSPAQATSTWDLQSKSVLEGQDCIWPSLSSKGPASLASPCAAAAEASTSVPASHHSPAQNKVIHTIFLFAQKQSFRKALKTLVTFDWSPSSSWR